jgi:carboxynorspermidine decarboxylase
MMETKTAGPGAFAALDLTRLPSPCFVVDEVRLEENLACLKQIADASGAQILAALKAFSMWELAGLNSRYLAGSCASGLWEAQLARAHYGGLLSTFSPAYREAEIDQIADLSDHVIFNSPAQLDRFAGRARAGGAEIGLRINPELPLGEVAKYDPAAAGSRLGLPVSHWQPELASRIDGLHIHSLCEQGLVPLQQLAAHIGPLLETVAGQIKWINLGGGHLITRPDYDRDGLITLLQELAEQTAAQIMLEPGTALAFDAGILVGEVLDVMENDGPVAILDISATCHMPDVLEAPYRPALMQEVAEGMEISLGGPSCLAGDMIGRYRLASRPAPGIRLAFLDQAHYSMVKTTTFNGVQLPALAVWNSNTDDLRIIREFTFEDFAGRLS